MIRRRVPVGLNEIGEPIMRQLQAKTEYELMLRAAKLIVESGVLGNYILNDGTPEKKEEKKTISFRDMAEWWYRVYKQDNPTLKPATSNDYRRMLDKVIYPAGGAPQIFKFESCHPRLCRGQLCQGQSCLLAIS